MSWRRCNTCKKDIQFGQKFWVCNVSTCNRKRTGLVFCDVACWDAHVPMMNHRESWAEERRAPTQEQWARIQAGEEEDPTHRRPKAEVEPSEEEAPSPAASPSPQASAPRVILRRSQS